MPPILRAYKRDQVLFKEGEASTSIYILKKGAIAIRKFHADSYVEIARLQAGEVIGELSFFDRLPRSATAVALIDLEVLEIPFDSLDKIYASIPDYMKTIMASLADRLRKANDQLRALQKQKPT